MSKIKILSAQEAIKIAAGEVIERPAHIIKELIENSIDAGAQTIIIHTQQAGKKEITITDDGYGMSEEDALLCFSHHATSKINGVQDLDTIATYGFRGEALSSIAAISHVELTTKTDFDTSATHITIDQGQKVEQTITAHPTGTTFKITNLFDQIPARKKFLKSNETEWNLITSIFQAFCLRYTTIHFKLFHDGKLSYNCPPSKNVIQRSAQLWSNNLHDQLIEINGVTQNNLSISGALSKSHYHRYNRNQIFTFVNNRWVKNIELSRAIIKGYQNVLPPQKYPAAFLFIEIDPSLIDVNIHPKKEEVKFLHPGIAQKTIQEVITQTLNTSISKTLQSDYGTSSTDIQIQNIEPRTVANFAPLQHQTSSFDNPFEKQIFQKQPPQTADHTISQNTKTNQLTTSLIQPQKNQSGILETNQTIYEQEPYSIIGQFKTTYILIEKKGDLIVIDQHAAHERILYEQLKKNFHDVATVRLLFPHVITLSKTDINLIMQEIKVFKKHGIIFEQFNEHELLIQATPASMQHKAIEDIIHTTLTWIKENSFVDPQDFFKQLNERIHTEKACKTACKAGDTLNMEQMKNIVQTLLTIENRFCCPHGRPTMWNLTLKEIEKQFKRDYKSQKSIDL